MLVGLAPILLRRRQKIAAWIVIGAALLSIGWSVRSEHVAAKASNDFSDQFFASLPKPLGWVDEATGDQPVLYLGQNIADPNGVWSMEFWNRNVRRVWSLDGTAPGPGPVLTPNIETTDGQLAGDPGYGYAVVDKGLSIVGETETEEGNLRLVRIGSPLRLRESLAGVFSDGWIGSEEPANTVSRRLQPLRRSGEAGDRVRDARTDVLQHETRARTSPDRGRNARPRAATETV